MSSNSRTEGNGNAVRRRLGSSDLFVSPVGLGLWPIAGISSLDVNDQDSLATIHAALDAGCNHIDTAFSYGYAGEADSLLAQVLAERRDEIIVASKVGQYFDDQQQRRIDGRPQTLLKHTELILQRLGVDCVDIMYLHAPDPHIPIRDSAAGIAEIIQRGWARYAGVSNVNSGQLREFHETCPVLVVQQPFNMLQQDAVNKLRCYCAEQDIGFVCYWILMKGLLAGKLSRDHQFDPGDKRLTYPMYQGQQWQRVQDFLDRLRGLAMRLQCTVAQLVVCWSLRQPNIQVALCGAKRAAQITETAQAMRLELAPQDLERIDDWIASFGKL